MSQQQNDVLYEDLREWLGTRGFAIKDIEKDRFGKFVYGNEKTTNGITMKLPLYLPEPYQELLC